tara:strand:- start:2502 stop:2825 length:324 start_codon:yes stop_codon:yes gene_type:complete
MKSDQQKPVQLGDIAFARSGDKGSSANVAVFAREPEHYPILVEKLTEARVAEFFKTLGPGRVTRYEVPNLLALNFVIDGVLDGGGSRSLRVDSQGKALGQAILELEL